MMFTPLPLKQAKPQGQIRSPERVYFFIGKVVKRENLLIQKGFFFLKALLGSGPDNPQQGSGLCDIELVFTLVYPRAKIWMAAKNIG